MGGYFEGPTGDIYAVICRYPAPREWEFQPLANGIIYSFRF